MAHALQLRIKTTSERLRTNHIELLEYTEKLTHENERLKSQVSKFLRGSSATLSGEGGSAECIHPAESDTDCGHAEQISALTSEVELLRKQLLSSEAEKKTIQAKSQLSRPDADIRARELRASLEKERILKDEYAERCRMAEADSLALSSQLESSRTELAEIRKQVTSYQDSKRQVKSEKEAELASADEKLKLIIREMDELKEYQNSCMEIMILKFKQEMDTQVSKERGAAGAFEQENKRLTAELIVANDDNNYLRKMVEELEAQLSRNDWSITTSSTPKPPLLTSALAEEAADLRREPELPDLSSSDRMTITCPNCVSEKESTDKNGFTFAEFVRLRQENRLLRMQLASSPVRGQSRSKTSARKNSK